VTALPASETIQQTLPIWLELKGGEILHFKASVWKQTRKETRGLVEKKKWDSLCIPVNY